MNTFTEEEAAKKWCPASRVIMVGNGSGDVPKGAVATGAPAGYNRSSEDDSAFGRCIGSHCMWWQWAETEGVKNRKGFCGAIWRFR